MYGRVFRIVDADAFTRDHLAGLGLPMGPAEAYPADPYQAKLDATRRSHTKGGAWPGLDLALSGLSVSIVDDTDGADLL